MPLTKEEIIYIIENNPNKKNIEIAVEKHSLLNMHVNGVGVHEHLSSLKDYESKLQTEVGNNIIESNKGIYSSLLQPLNKVFSAKGGVRHYNLPKYSTEDFKEKLESVVNGLSIRKWLEKRVLNKYITDPNGIIFLEVKEGVATPTFKSIKTIYDYETNGQEVNYIVFKPQKGQGENKDKKYYRVVDDSFDYWIEVGKEGENNTYKINNELTFSIFFPKCPAFIVSDILDDIYDIKSSFIHQTLDKANTFLYENAIASKHKLLHGFSKYWEIGRDCSNCEGSGIVVNEDGNTESCHICNGTGARPFGDVTDKLSVPFPEDKDTPILTKYAGYDSPDIEIIKQYKEDLKDHEQSLNRMLWSINYIGSQNTSSKTATETVLEVQPINEKLHSVSDNFEKCESFITDMLGHFYYETAYKGASINYGRRYLIESVDAVFEKLTKSIKDKMPVVFVMNIAKEYIQSLYSNNELEASIHLKLLNIEPFPFMSVNDVISLNLEDEEKKKKIFFQEWYSLKTDAELMLKSKESLKKDLELYVTSKNLKKDETQEVRKIS